MTPSQAPNQPSWEDRIGRRLKLRDLHVLAEVVRCGSMAKAAAQLAMSQPAVSEAISGLERAVGIRLLDRHAQGVGPTIYAEVLIRRTRAVFDELRQGVREIEFLSDSTVGEIRIACPEFVSAGMLPRAIGTFIEKYPGVSFQVVHQDTTSLQNQELQDRVVDIVLRRLPDGFQDDDLITESLFHDPHWIVAGMKSPWARRRKISLDQLCEEPWILPPSPMIFDLLNSGLASRGLRLTNVSVTSASLLLRSELLASGRYISILPSILVRNARTWDLKHLEVDFDMRSPPISLMMLRKRTPSPVVQRFIEHLRAIAATIR
ncbi:LysR family transcriptional regulator [Cupriavidus sp. CP313]